MSGVKRLWEKLRCYFLNIHFLVCFGIAWMITNGWAYLGLILGSSGRLPVLTAVSSAYLAFLWLPFTAEKIVTVLIAVWLLKRLYPDDIRTLELFNELRGLFRKKH